MLPAGFPSSGIVQEFRMNGYDEQWGKNRVSFVLPPPLRRIAWMSLSLEINKNCAEVQDEKSLRLKAQFK
jgi:hypothetical protein